MILIVEGNKDHALSLELLLKVHGFNDVKTVGRFDAAVKIIKSHKPTAVILDLILPCGMDYREMIRQLATQHGCGVVVVTGMDDGEPPSGKSVAGECITAGATDVLVKGRYSASDLWSAVSRSIHQTRTFDKFDTAISGFDRTVKRLEDDIASVKNKGGSL